MWSLEVSVAPLLEPLTLQEVKDHLRTQFSSDEDAYLDALIVAARQAMEAELSLALLTQTRKLRLNGWPCSGCIWLPRPPVQSVTSITYLESTAGASTTLAATEYTLVGARTTPDLSAPLGHIVPAYLKVWPSLWPVPENVTITYVCGWATRGAIPQAIRQAMLLTIADLYEQREVTIVGTIVARIPTIENLIATHRCVHEFGEDCG
jgi:uncharacterized phiE125 gp8 family phage protein